MDNENYYQNEPENQTTPEEQKATQSDNGYEPPKYEPQGYEPSYNYQPYTVPEPPKKKRNGLGIASLVIGIISLISCCCWWLSILLGVVSIILGIVSLVQKEDTKGFAVVGIILGSIGIVLTVALVFTVVYMYDSGMMDQLGTYYYNEYGVNPFENIY